MVRLKQKRCWLPPLWHRGVDRCDEFHSQMPADRLVRPARKLFIVIIHFCSYWFPSSSWSWQYPCGCGRVVNRYMHTKYNVQTCIQDQSIPRRYPKKDQNTMYVPVYRTKVSQECVLSFVNKCTACSAVILFSEWTLIISGILWSYNNYYLY